MANNYLLSSFAIETNEEGCKLFDNIWEITDLIVNDDHDDEDREKGLAEFPEDLIEKVRPMAEKWKDYGSVEENYHHDGDGLWFHHDECFNVDQAADLLQVWLKVLEEDRVILITWAETCSKPRVGEFNGGAVVVTKDSKYWFNGGCLAERAITGLMLPSGKNLVLDAQMEAGWTEKTVLELLYQFMDQNPLAKVEFDAFLQRHVAEEVDDGDS